MAAKTLATYIGELSAGSSLGSGDKVATLEAGAMVYFDGAAFGGGITALTGDVTASGTGSVAATIANLAVTNAKVATGIDAAKIADGSVSNAEFQYLGGVTSDIQTQLNAKQAGDADLTTIAGLTPSDDDFLQRKSGAWANRTIAQVKTDLGVPTYAKYVALLSQTGTDAPVATVLENTLGGTVVWTRNDAGDYTGTLAGVFTENKTALLPIPASTNFAYMQRASDNAITLLTYTPEASSTDDALSSSFVEIRVYP